jgi:hypothetical protein
MQSDGRPDLQAHFAAQARSDGMKGRGLGRWRKAGTSDNRGTTFSQEAGGGLADNINGLTDCRSSS